MDRSKDEAHRPPEEPDLFPMIYVNKVENLAGGPTRGMPRRWFRTSAGLNNPDPGPRHPHTLTVLGLRYFIRLLSLDRCSAGIMILRNLLRLEKGQILCRSSGRVVYVESLRDLGGYSKRNRNYGWLLLREGKDRSFFIFFFLQLSNSFSSLLFISK